MSNLVNILIVMENEFISEKILCWICENMNIDYVTLLLKMNSFPETVLETRPDIVLLDLATASKNREKIQEANTLLKDKKVILHADETGGPYREAASRLGDFTLVETGRLYDYFENLFAEAGQ